MTKSCALTFSAPASLSAIMDPRETSLHKSEPCPGRRLTCSLTDLGFTAIPVAPGKNVYPDGPAADRPFDLVFLNVAMLNKADVAKVRERYPLANVSCITKER